MAHRGWAGSLVAYHVALHSGSHSGNCGRVRGSNSYGVEERRDKFLTAEKLLTAGIAKIAEKTGILFACVAQATSAVKILSMSQATPATTESFGSRTIDRIRRTIVVLGIAGLITTFAIWGWRIGIGFAIGSAVGYVNFYWLEKGVEGVIKLTIERGTPASSRRIVQRFLLRYFLMALVAFVILTVSRESLYGLFAGLLLPVAAILCEAAYQMYVVLARGT
jgi:ATP synthase I chain